MSYQKIRAYLLGELTPEQSKDFEAKLAADVELAEEVELHRNLLPALDRLKERNLHANFQKWKMELEGEKDPLQGTWFRWYYVAIAILLILLGALWFFSRDNSDINKKSEASPVDTLQQEALPPQSDSIVVLEKPTRATPPTIPKSKSNTTTSLKDSIQIVAAKNLSEDFIASIDFPKVPLGIRGPNDGDVWEKLVSQADSAAKLQNFQEALKLLNSVRDTPEAEAHLLYRFAYLYSKLGDHNLAISNYEKYLSFDYDLEKTNWELALYYLASYPNNKKEFWGKMDSILMDPEHRHHANAEKLATELQSAGIVRQ